MKKTKYIVRKNHFFRESRYHYTGNATQIIDIYKEFNLAKESMFKELKVTLSEMIGNCEEMWNSQYHYNLRHFMKYASIDSKSKFGYMPYLENEFYYSHINTLEDIELLNYFYPTRAVEIVLCQEDFLYAPKYNTEYFQLHNRDIPESKFRDENGGSHQFLDKGLFVDENDYMSNIFMGTNRNKLLSLYNGIDVRDEYFVNIEILNNMMDARYPCVTAKDSKLNIDSKIGLNQLLDFQNLLKIQPIKFVKIPLEDVANHEIQEYEQIVLDAAKWLGGSYSSVSEVLNSSNGIECLSLNKDFTDRLAKHISNK